MNESDPVRCLVRGLLTACVLILSLCPVRVGAQEKDNKDEELSWKDRQKMLVVELIGHVGSGDREAFVKLLNGSVQKLVDPERLGAELQRMAARLGPAGKIDWQTVEIDGADRNMGSEAVFSVPVEFEKGPATCRVVYADFEPMGISVTAEGFAADTHAAIDPPAGLPDHARDFWLSLYHGEPEKAYELMIPKGEKELFPREQFLSLGKQIALGEQLKVRKLHLNAVRLANSAEGDGCGLAVFHLVERSDDRYSTCRLRYTVQEGGSFRLTSFDVNQFDDRYPVSGSGKQEEILTALSSGEIGRILPLIHPLDAAGIHKPTFTAYVEAFAEMSGPFRSIPPGEFSAQRVYAKDGSVRTEATGRAVFEKQAFGFSLGHMFGLFEHFDFQLPDGVLDHWAAGIKDTTDYEEHGKKFLREMTSGDLDVAMRMLPKKMQDEFNGQRENLIKRRTEFLGETGPFKDIKMTGKEFVAKEDSWQISYLIEFEKESVKGWVGFRPTPFTAHISAFNYRRGEADGE